MPTSRHSSPRSSPRPSGHRPARAQSALSSSTESAASAGYWHAYSTGSIAGNVEVRDIGLYGFGRIGRLLARILIDRAGGTGMRLRAIVVRRNGENDIVKRASLLRRDSVHGAFDGSIVVDEEA